MSRPKLFSAGLILAALVMWLEIIPTAAHSRSSFRRITDLSVKPESDRVVISATGNGPLRFRQGHLSNPERLYFDFQSTTIASKVVRKPEEGGPVESVVLASHRGRYPRVRMVVKMRGAPSYRMVLSEDRSQLTLEVKSSTEEAASPSEVSLIKEASAVATSPVVKKASAPASKPTLSVLPAVQAKPRVESKDSTAPASVVRVASLDPTIGEKEPEAAAEKPAKPRVEKAATIQVARAAKPRASRKPRVRIKEVARPMAAKPGKPKAVETPSKVRPMPTVMRVASVAPGFIDMDFVNADLNDIAKALSIQSGQNVAVSGSAQGKATLRLKQASLEESLRLVASLNNLDYRKIDNTYIIATASELKRLTANAGVSQSYITRHVAPADAADLLSRSYPHLTIQAQPQANAITLQGLPEDINQAMATLSQIDVPPPPEANVTETILPRYIEVDALADTLRNAFPQVSLQQNEKALVLTGPKTHVEKAKQVVATLDVETALVMAQKVVTLKYITAGQVVEMIDALGGVTVTPGPESRTPQPSLSPQQDRQLTSLKLEAITAPQFGLELGGGGGRAPAGAGAGGASAGGGAQGAEERVSLDEKKRSNSRTIIIAGSAEAVDRAIKLIETIDVAPPQVMIEAKLIDVSPEVSSNLGLSWSRSVPSSLIENGDPLRDINFGTFLRTPLQIDAAINAAVTNKKAKILANPRIAVLDNQDANIFIGDLLRYRVLAGVSTGGQQFFDVKDVPVGIILLARPRVSPDGNITMRVHPVVSTVTALVGPDSIPQTSSREADSTIRVKDGETIVIAGLLREEELKTMSKVPILGDIPVLGALFQNRERSFRRSEVMVFLTPRIMRD